MDKELSSVQGVGHFNQVGCYMEPILMGVTFYEILGILNVSEIYIIILEDVKILQIYLYKSARECHLKNMNPRDVS